MPLTDGYTLPYKSRNLAAGELALRYRFPQDLWDKYSCGRSSGGGQEDSGEVSRAAERGGGLRGR